MENGGQPAISTDEPVRGQAAQTPDSEVGTPPGTQNPRVILKEAVEIACSKKTDLAIALVVEGRLPVKPVAETLKISLSNLSDRKDQESPKSSDYRRNQRISQACL